MRRQKLVPKREKRGQAVIEFALVLPLLLLMLLAMLDYGWYWQTRINSNSAARNGARYASVHPTAWSNASQPPDNSIEGQILDELAGSPAGFANTDSSLEISYYDLSGSIPKLCGAYSASGGGFVGAAGYSQTSCVIPGNEVWITLKASYQALSPTGGAALGSEPGGIPILEQATEVIQ